MEKVARSITCLAVPTEMMHFSGCSCAIRNGSTPGPLTIHWVAGLASSEGRYHDVDVLRFLSFKYSVIKGLGWRGTSDSVLLRSILAPSTIIPWEANVQGIGVREIAPQWSRLVAQLEGVSSQSLACVEFTDIRRKDLFGIVFDPSITGNYKGVKIQPRSMCNFGKALLRNAGEGTSNAGSVKIEFLCDIIDPVTHLLQYAVQHKFAVLVDVEDPAKKSKHIVIGQPIVPTTNLKLL